MIKVISFIVTVVILLFFLIYNIIVKKRKNEVLIKISEFFDRLNDDFINIICDTIDKVDATGRVDVDDFEEFSNEILLTIYNNSWNLVCEQLEKQFGEHKYYSLIKKIVTKEHVEEIVCSIYEQSTFQNRIKTVMTDEARKIIKEIEDEEKAAEKEAESYEKASEEDVDNEYNGEHDISEFEAGRMSMVEPEYPDNESPYEEKDETMELISEDIQETPINEELEHIISSSSED